jgi:hypothetical protein
MSLRRETYRTSESMRGHYLLRWRKGAIARLESIGGHADLPLLLNPREAIRIQIRYRFQ